MMAVPSFSISAMDAMHQDENMDFASDMHVHDGDFDFDLPDASRGPSAEPGQDVMIEDDQDVTNQETSNVDPKDSRDDDMVDEEFVGEEIQNVDESMEHDDGQNSATMYDDEDLIYEDEDVIENEEQESDDIEFKEEDFIAGEEAIQYVDNSVTVDDIKEQAIEQPGSSLQARQAETGNNDIQEQPTTTPPEQLDSQALASSHEPDLQSLSKFADSSIPTGEPQSIDSTLPSEAQSEGLKSAAVAVEELTIPDASNSGEAGAVDQTTVSATGAADDANDQPDSEGQTGDNDTSATQLLHPIKVQYEGAELCLFPPLEGEDTFFVQDATLAFSPCDQLLGACREVLGESIHNDHELVLDFPSLGLHLSEGSSYATEITLAQILDIYVTLCHNDRMEQLPPLQCKLSTRITLASQYAFLLSAANEGKGLADVRYEVDERSKSHEAFETVSNQDAKSESGDQTDETAQHAEPQQPIEERLGETQDEFEQSNARTSLPTGLTDRDQTHATAADELSGQAEILQDGDENFDDSKSDISSQLELGAEAEISNDQEQDDSTYGLETLDKQDGIQQLPGTQPQEGNQSTSDADSDRTVRPETPHGEPGQPATESAGSTAVNDSALVETGEYNGLSASADATTENLSSAETGLPEASLVTEDDREDDPSDLLIASEADDSTIMPEHFSNDAGTINIEESAQPTESGNGKDNVVNGETTHLINGMGAREDQPAHQVDSADEDTVHDAHELLEDGLGLGDEQDLLEFTEGTAAEAPTSKRKLQEDDDYGLIDPATPEKKKRRPS